MKLHLIALCATVAFVTGCRTDADWRTVTYSPRATEGIYKREGAAAPHEPAGADSQSREGLDNPFLMRQQGADTIRELENETAP